MARIALTTPKSATPIVCELEDPPDGMILEAAESTDSTGNSKAQTIAPDGLSFSLDVSQADTFVVTAVANSLPDGDPVSLVERGGPTLDVFDDPATLLVAFEVQVTP
jgi:hypothetical protein